MPLKVAPPAEMGRPETRPLAIFTTGSVPADIALIAKKAPRILMRINLVADFKTDSLPKENGN
jgi:hypothetical protein